MFNNKPKKFKFLKFSLLPISILPALTTVSCFYKPVNKSLTNKNELISKEIKETKKEVVTKEKDIKNDLVSKEIEETKKEVIAKKIKEVVTEENKKEVVTKEEDIKNDLVSKEIEETKKDLIPKKNKKVANKPEDIKKKIEEIFNQKYTSKLENRKLKLPSSLLKNLNKQYIWNVLNKLGGFHYKFSSFLKFADLIDLTPNDIKGEITLKISFKLEGINEFIANLKIIDFCTSSEWENDYKPVQAVLKYFNNAIVKKFSASSESQSLDYFLGKINQEINPWDFGFKNNFLNFIKMNNVSVKYYLTGHGLGEQLNLTKESSASGWILVNVKIQKNHFKEQTEIGVDNLQIENQKQVNEVSETLFAKKFDINLKTLNRFKILPSEFISLIKSSDLNLVSDKILKKITGNQIYNFWEKIFKFPIESSQSSSIKEFMNSGGKFWFRKFTSDDKNGELTFELVVEKGHYWKVNKITVEGFLKK